MEKILVTGLSGFVGRHFLEFIDKNEIPAEILGLDVSPNKAAGGLYKKLNCASASIDLLDAGATQSCLSQFQPSSILHLAASSSVAYSWQNPAAGFRNNINAFFNLLEAVRLLKLPARILAVGSAEGYGHVRREDVPLRETQPLAPGSPYAAARASQEQLAKVYQRGYGLDIVMTRSFNHIGPGQRDDFAVAAFVKQLVGIKKKSTPDSKLIVGDISVVRDFLDVRDVVRAYYRLLKKGRGGEVYNVCSGRGYALEEAHRDADPAIGDTPEDRSRPGPDSAG